MKDLISKLDAVQHLSPDEIVAAISDPLDCVFDIRTYKPWTFPEHLRGRHVLIEYVDYDGPVWFLDRGEGSSSERHDGVGWKIEDAFRLFFPSDYNEYSEEHVILHLLEPGHAQIPSPDTGRISYPWS